MSILIAEDMAFQRDYLRAIIADNFAEAGPVIETDDGGRAVELARERRPALVILDIKLAGCRACMRRGRYGARRRWRE